MSIVSRYRAWVKELRRQRGGRILPFSLASSSAKLLVMLLITLLALVGAFFGALAYLQPEGGSPSKLLFSDLQHRAEAGEVVSATFYDFDHRVVGALRTPDGERTFVANYPSSDTQTPFLINKLVTGGAAVSIEPQATKDVVQFVATYLLPLVILANLFGLIFVGTKSGGSDAIGGLAEFSSIGKGRNAKGGSGVTTFADVAGAQDAIVELAEVRDYLKDPAKYAALGAQPPKGVMMLGPPGCGKTLMARAVAGEAGVPFFSISGAEFVESLVGVGAARVRDLFRQVRAYAPAIVFIDEIDAAGRRRGGVAGGQEEREQTLNQLLIEMDGFDSTSGVVVIGATNRPDILDPALLRPGRFDRQVTVEPPDLEGRMDILKLYADRSPVEGGIDFEYLARRTSGYTGAELANVVNEAALLAVRAGRATVVAADFEEAVQRVGSGPKRRGHVLTPEERLRSAHHEAAHVVAGAITGRLGDVPRVSIVAHGRTLGLTAGRGWAERTLLTRSELFTELVTLMAGGVCELLFFGEPSTGSDHDLERATAVAQMMVGRYGMSERLGDVRLLRIEGSEFLSDEMIPHHMVSETVLTELHREVQALLAQAKAAAEKLIAANRDTLALIVDGLLDHESLEGNQIEPLIHHLRPSTEDGDLVRPPAKAPSATRRSARRASAVE